MDTNLVILISICIFVGALYAYVRKNYLKIIHHYTNYDNQLGTIAEVLDRDRYKVNVEKGKYSKGVVTASCENHDDLQIGQTVQLEKIKFGKYRIKMFLVSLDKHSKKWKEIINDFENFKKKKDE